MSPSMQRLIFWIVVIALSSGATYAWFNDSLFAPFSEQLWSFYNALLDGQKPGVASNLEFFTVLLGSLIIFWATGCLIRLLTLARARG